MFNSDKPDLEKLPSSAQLLRSTAIAAISAAVILVTVVLPAEYGIDPTGAGRFLGLTEMGEIKQELEEEAEQDRQRHGQEQSSRLLDGLFGLIVGTAQAEESWRDTVTFTLAPGDYTEIKLVMAQGEQAWYSWEATGGRVNFDLHAHGGGKSHSYEKGRGASEGEGEITAPFAGDHGWFWRNRDKSAVTITLRLRGDYSDLVQGE